MKKISYLDMVREILSEQEFFAFENQYTKPLQKSLKPIFSRIDFSLFKEKLQEDGRLMQCSDFSSDKKRYDDVFFVEKQDALSL
ncbi:MAG: hypothetical protein LBH96_02515 [Candidatus Peribacteria bacterium]|jgi:hypothetical protein|nr:hypothetical protein [Candidatus Peribacteria bacterium]